MNHLLKKLLFLLFAATMVAACGSQTADDPDEGTDDGKEASDSDSDKNDSDDNDDKDSDKDDDKDSDDEKDEPKELEAASGNQIIETDDFAFEAPEELSILEDADDIDRLFSLGADALGDLPGGLTPESLAAQLQQVDLVAIDTDTGSNINVLIQPVGNMSADQYLQANERSFGSIGAENVDTSTESWDGGEIAVITYDLPAGGAVFNGKILAFLDGKKVYQVTSTSEDPDTTAELADLVEESFQLQ